MAFLPATSVGEMMTMMAVLLAEGQVELRTSML
jgi:hypothetical protein